MITYTCKNCGRVQTMDTDEEVDSNDSSMIYGTYEGEVYISCDECGNERKIY